MARRTAGLARTTSQSVQEGRKEAKHSRLPMLGATRRSRVVVVPIANENATDCGIEAENVGTGVALIESAAVQFPPDSEWKAGSVSNLLVRALDVVNLGAKTAGQPAEDRIYIRVTYTDILGEQRTTSYFHIADDQGQWKCTGQAFVREGELLKGLENEEAWPADWLKQEGYGYLV
jgi:hypothetical protein